MLAYRLFIRSLACKVKSFGIRLKNFSSVSTHIGSALIG